jgi:regulator of RNase E activity RraA
MSLSPELRAALAAVSTATIHTILLKQGIRRSFMVGPQSITGSTERFVGEAFTLRFIPSREDVATPASWGNPISTRAAIEEMPEGVIAVADAMGVKDAGIFGDILAVRMAKRGVVGLVTDGMMRDRIGVLASGLPIWCAGIAAPSSVNGLTFVGWQEPVGCGGVAVFPGDLIVADNDGAVCVPQALVSAVVKEAVEQEAFEAWAADEVMKGAKLPGLYPPNEETKARYAAFRASKN